MPTTIVQTITARTRTNAFSIARSFARTYKERLFPDDNDPAVFIGVKTTLNGSEYVAHRYQHVKPTGTCWCGNLGEKNVKVTFASTNGIETVTAPVCQAHS